MMLQSKGKSVTVNGEKIDLTVELVNDRNSAAVRYGKIM